MTKFTQEQLNVIEAAANKLYTQPERTNPDDLIAEITKSDWEPKFGQVYKGKANYVLNRYQSFGGDSPRPLTTKEAGAECMQHLLDVLDEMERGKGWQTFDHCNYAEAALEKHKRLIK